MAVQKKTEAVEHPDHYNVGGFECLDVLHALGLGFNLGNAFKYIWRAGRKQPCANARDRKALEDLKKARFYLDDEIRRRALMSA